MTTYTLRDLWIKACELDGIDPTSKFVVFSKDNRWAKKYNTLALLISQTPVLPKAPSQRPISF
jgi:hypothetical protein